MNRREFVAGLAGAAAWPINGRAQEQRLLIGWLHSASAMGGYSAGADVFVSALKEAGFHPGHSVHIEYRWADDDFGKLGAFAADLVVRNVSVIFAGGGDITATAAKNATSKIPIVFAMGADPIKAGLVSSLSQPGGNITGITFLVVQLRPKLIQLVRELLPTARSIAILLNPHRPNATAVEKELASAAADVSLQPTFLWAGTEQELDQRLSSLVSQRPDS